VADTSLPAGADIESQITFEKSRLSFYYIVYFTKYFVTGFDKSYLRPR
jgi:hypothetical protein